jgi:hypothetical protein
VLGYVAFPPDRQWSYGELIAFLPNASSFGRGKSPEEFKAAIDEAPGRRPDLAPAYSPSNGFRF